MSNSFTSSSSVNSHVIKKLKTRYEARDKCDFTIVSSDDSEFPVHLSEIMEWDYMSTLISASMKEKTESRMKLKTVHSKYLDPILRFVYYGETIALAGKNIEYIAEFLLILDQLLLHNYAEFITNKFVDFDDFPEEGIELIKYYENSIKNIECKYHSRIYNHFKKLMIKMFDKMWTSCRTPEDYDYLKEWKTLPNDIFVEFINGMLIRNKQQF